MSAPQHSGPTPDPWRAADRPRSRAFARLLGAMHQHRERLLAWYPLVRVPSAGKDTVTPVAALLLVWEKWDYAHGPCPRCSAPALATCFGGLMSTGSVSGHCIACGAVVTRHVGGFGRVLDGCRRATEGTPWRIPFRSFPGGWTLSGEPRDLVAVLQELGAEKLPNPRSRVFRR